MWVSTMFTQMQLQEWSINRNVYTAAHKGLFGCKQGFQKVSREQREAAHCLGCAGSSTLVTQSTAMGDSSEEYCDTTLLLRALQCAAQQVIRIEWQWSCLNVMQDRS